MRISEEARDRRRAALEQAIDSGEIVLRPQLMWDLVRHGGTPVLSLRWADEDMLGRPSVDEVLEFGGSYFADSVRGRCGPFATLEDALVGLTGEAAIPLAPGLLEIESSEWNGEEIRSRIRWSDPEARVRVNGVVWTPPADAGRPS